MKPRHLGKLSDFFTRVLHSNPIITKNKFPAKSHEGTSFWPPRLATYPNNPPVDVNILYSLDGYQKKRLEFLITEIHRPAEEALTGTY